ncbi:MAG: AMP-binding protein [Magnetococcales bacterium]|nr:AMP-binding protein [Magnetococcales bacterium]
MSPTLISHLLEARLKEAPEGIFLQDGKRTRTFQETHKTVSQIAESLIQLGVEPGTRVGIFLDHGMEQALALLATSLAGGVFVLINPILRPNQIQHILNDCTIQILITDGTKGPTLRETLAATEVKNALILPPGKASPQVEQVLFFNEDTAHNAPLPQPPAREPTDTSHIIYTSGSTGLPKGIMVSHRNSLDGARIVSGYTGLTADDRILGVLPLSFDYGLNQLFNALHVGARYHFHRFFLPNNLIQAIHQEKITVLAGIPPIWAKLMDPKLIAKDRLPPLDHLRVITNSGGKMPRTTIPKLQQLFPQAQIFLMYGLTEAFRSSFLAPQELAHRPDSIGQALPEVELHVLDPSGKICPPGEVGELVHAGALISQGYWQRPQASAKVFRTIPLPHASGDKKTGQPPRQVPVVFTGDLVWRDEAGFLYYQGRRDAMIKSKGYRISPGEVEEMASNLPGIRECVAAGFEQNDENHLRLFVTLSNPDLTEKEIQALCRKAAPFYLVPDQVVILKRFPLTPNGKLDRVRVVQDHEDR